MSAEDEQRFQSSNKGYIYDKLFHVGDKKSKRSFPVYCGFGHIYWINP